MYQVTESFKEDLNLTNCDQEPIHIPGSIQPHGIMLAITEPDLKIVQVSNNTQEVLGKSPVSLLGQCISIILGTHFLQHLNTLLTSESLINSPVFSLPVQVGEHEQLFDVITHRSGNLVVLELEPLKNRRLEAFAPDFQFVVRETIHKLTQTIDLKTMSQTVAEEIRKITGFDRIMVYQFDEEWNGTVIAESLRDISVDSYMDLHFPSLDIPKQARDLYTRNWLRLIPNIYYEPATIIASENAAPSTIDLSFSVLRSVSPIHIEYLKNMHVGASMSISILKNQQLWGLIACHHETSRYVPYSIRNASELLGKYFSAKLSETVDRDQVIHREKLKQLKANLMEHISKEDTVTEGLNLYSEQLLELVDARGAAICLEGEECITLGQTPEHAEISGLISWLIEERLKDELYETNSLSSVYPPASSFIHVASGVIALSIGRDWQSYLLWFRPEVLQTVNWAGNPHKAVEVYKEGTTHGYMPRKSFEIWKEIVRHKSIPWKPFEIEVAYELRDSITGLLLHKNAKALSEAKEVAEQANKKKSQFLASMSHEIKTPLNGVIGYSDMLKSGMAGELNEKQNKYLDNIVSSGKHLLNIVTDILDLSKIEADKVDLLIETISISSLLTQIRSIISSMALEKSISLHFDVEAGLTEIQADAGRLRQIFLNFLSNAIKYNRKNGTVSLRLYKQNTWMVVEVEDTGIGIPQNKLNGLFQEFFQVRNTERQYEGTGLGLVITQRLIELHGGKILAVESQENIGSTFTFRLPLLSAVKETT